MANWTFPSTHFCAANYPLMKQLKPFRFYDDASQEQILKRAWTKLNGKTKQFYVNLVKDGNTRDLALKNVKVVDGLGSDNAFAIYRTEMRVILLQDPLFVKDHYHELQDVIEEGWEGLSGTQRLDFYKRVTLAKTDGYIKIADKKKSLIKYKAFGEGPKHFELQYINGSKGFAETRDTEWTSHDYKILTNPIDNAAFKEYADIVHADEPSLSGKAIWRKWMDLDHEERESYYRKAFETAASMEADTLFVQEKRIYTKCDITNFKQYNTEKIELEQAWNDASDEVRKVYIDGALNEYLEKDKNPETRFLGIYNYNKEKFAARTTTIDDVNAELTPLLPLNFVHKDNLVNAFRVYMEKMRPELLKQPEMIQKRFWEVNEELWHMWRHLSEEEQQPYFDIVRRYLQIRRKLKGWQVEAWKILGEDMEHRREFLALDAEAKKKHGEVALHNRKTLLKKFPDLHDYYFWMTPELNRYELEYVNKFTSSTNVNEKVQTAPQKPTTPYSPLYDYLEYADVPDMDAFHEYQNDVETMVSKYITTKVWWRQFVNLTDEERNVYYDRAIKTAAAKQARILFAEDNCTVIKKSSKDQAYADEMSRLHQAWKNLSDPARKYYLELAEQQLLQREKRKPEDRHFKSNSVHFCDIEIDTLHCDGHLVPKYSHYMSTFDKPEKHALTVYMKKHFTELYNQPGMAEKRYFQLSLILEQRFMKLSDEERQIYLDIVHVICSINDEIRNRLQVTPGAVFSLKHRNNQRWEDVSCKEKAVCEEEAKQNLKTLMEKYPVMTEHFHWMVYRRTSTESKTETSTNVETAETEKPTVTNETTTEAPKGTESDKLTANGYTSEESDTSASWEVVKNKTLPHELEGVRIVRLDLELGENIETLAKAVKHPITAKTIIKKQDSVKTVSVEIQEPAVDGNTSEDSEASATWEVVKDEKNNLKDETSKSGNNEVIEVAVSEEVNHAISNPMSVNLQKPLLNVTTAKESGSADSFEVLATENNTEEIVPSKSTEELKSSVNSAQSKKTPTAFMFYKKAMRRLNADQNFGKKDNESQRKALIAGWKKLSDEEKAVYFEKENRARAQNAQEQLLQSL